MYLGHMMELTDRDRLYAQPMHPYTQSLMSAVPIPDPKHEIKQDRILLTGDIPSPINPPSGCVFHTRCPKYRDQLSDSQKERCRTEEPAFEAKRPDHLVGCHFAEVRVDNRLAHDPGVETAADPSSATAS